MVTDLDFADDIALVSDTASKAQDFLDRVETAATHVGLHNECQENQMYDIQPKGRCVHKNNQWHYSWSGVGF